MQNVRDAVLASLKACSQSRDLERGRKIHAELLQSQLHLDTLIAKNLLQMYIRCNSMVEARTVFNQMEPRTVIAWNTLIMGYVENGESEHALRLVTRMDSDGLSPNSWTLVAGLKACVKLAEKDEYCGKVVESESLKNCRRFEALAKKEKCESHLFVANTLMNAYTSCGSMSDGKRIFDGMSFHDVAAWNTLILGYAENSRGDAALEVFLRMRSGPERCEPDSRTFLAVAKACSVLASKDGKKMEALEKGMALHSEAVRYGCLSDVFVCSSFIDMYSKSGSMRDARMVFEKMRHRNVVSWTALLMGYAENGEAETAFQLFQLMQAECDVNSRTFLAVLKACVRESERQQQSGNSPEVNVPCLEKGMAVDSHLTVKQLGLKFNLLLENSLIDMYSKCRSMSDARRVFDRIQHHDVISWNSLLLGYVDNGEPEVTLQLFTEMKRQGRWEPDGRTFLAALRACANLAAKEEGREIDGKVVKLETLELGMDIHSQAMKSGCSDTDMFVANILVDMYAKCGVMSDARRVFDGMQRHTVVSWTAIILGYAEAGDGESALELFLRMRTETELRDACLYVAALKGCTASGLLHQGKFIHAEICRHGLESFGAVESSLVDFYGKCGSIAGAERVFDGMAAGDVVTWTALLATLSRQGDSSDRVFELFRKMEVSRIRPVGATFLALLTACSHAGLVERGREYFEAMKTGYGIQPDIDHYHCLVDLLGRSNQPEAALEVIKSMPFEPTAVSWTTLLAACQERSRNSHQGVSRLGFEELLSLDKEQAVAYVLMTNLCRNERL